MAWECKGTAGSSAHDLSGLSSEVVAAESKLARLEERGRGLSGGQRGQGHGLPSLQKPDVSLLRSLEEHLF